MEKDPNLFRCIVALESWSSNIPFPHAADIKEQKCRFAPDISSTDANKIILVVILVCAWSQLMPLD